MIRVISLRLILVRLIWKLKETIQTEERTLERDIIVITQGLALKPDIGHVATGNLEDLYLTILKANK
jgi:hypothetical protein